MVKAIFDNKKLGKYPRRYDLLSEESEREDDKAIIADMLQWMEVETVGGLDLGQAKDRKDIMEMMDVGMTLGSADKVSAISQLQNSPLKSHLHTGANKIFYDIYYGAKDLLSKRKVKSTLTVLAGIGVGVAVGVVLGTVVFPGIGSAIGGAVGGVIAGAVAAVGGGIGLGIIGGVIGSWLGNKIANKAFKDEKHYELSKRLTSKVKEQYGISGRTQQMMNAYLYNRQQAVKSPLCRRYYRMLRKNGIKKGDSVAVEKLAHYFSHELSLLNLELKEDQNNESLLEDKRAVLHILRQLKNAEGIPYATRKRIEKTLDDLNKKPELPPARMVVDNDDSLDSKEAVEQNSSIHEPIGQINRRFVNHLNNAKLDITKIEAEHHRPGSVNHSYYKYHIERHNQPDLPDITYREVKVNANHYTAEVLVDREQLDEGNKEAVSAVLVAQARAIYETSGNKHLKVISDGDDDLAVRLMAAALVANMVPELDEEEYPLETPVQREKRELLIEQAYSVAGITPPHKAKKARVGFKVDFEP